MKRNNFNFNDCFLCNIPHENKNDCFWIKILDKLESKNTKEELDERGNDIS